MFPRTERARGSMPDDISTHSTSTTLADPIGVLDLAHAIVCDRDGRIAFWSRANEELYGWTKAEAAGKSRDALLSSGPEARLGAAHAAVAKDQRWRGELLRRHRDGRILTVRATWVLRQDAAGAPLGMLEISEDLTALRRAEEKARDLEGTVLEAGEREARRLGQAMHDQLCQNLLGAAFAIKALVHSLAEEGSPHREPLEAITQLIHESIRETREIMRGLNPVEIDAGSLLPALQELLTKSERGTRGRVECEDPALLANCPSARQLYRIAQEAVDNARRHSGATEIVLRLRAADAASTRLEVSDNGRGLASTHPCGLGISIMRYRAQAMGGNLMIESSNRGTTIVCLFPRNL